MSTEEPCEASTDQGSPLDGKENTSAQAVAGMNQKSGKQLAHTIRATAGKNDSRYWLPRVFRPVNARGAASPHYSMKVQFRGRRMAFTLGTGNKDAAAKRAAAIYGELLAHGIEATLARRRAQRPEGENVATIGEYLSAAQSVMAVRPASFTAYATYLRRIAGDILNLRAAPRAKTRQKRATRQAIENAPLSILTADAIQAWRLSFVARAAGSGTKARSARISSNSMIKQAKSLFAPKVLKFLGALRLPAPFPFSGVQFFPRESMRYQSKIDPAALLKTAQDRLALANSEAFKALILALGAGLRRGEIDRLLWRQIDFRTGVIRVEATEVADLKSEDSAGEVAIDATLCGLLQGFKAKASSKFVIEGPEEEKAISRAWGHAYRCTQTFDFLLAWLREQGVDGNKPLHTLRKEAGAMVATRQGIYAASRFLRHADIQVTAQHYADHKERITVDMGALLHPGNVIAMQPDGQSAKSMAKARRK